MTNLNGENEEMESLAPLSQAELETVTGGNEWDDAWNAGWNARWNAEFNRRFEQTLCYGYGCNCDFGTASRCPPGYEGNTGANYGNPYGRPI